MKKRSFAALLAVIMLVSLVSCSGASNDAAIGEAYKPGAGDYNAGYDAMDKNESAGNVSKPSEDGVGSLGSLEAVTDTARKRIQYVTVSLESKEYDKTLETVKGRAAAVGGYIETSNERGLGIYGGGSRSANIVFRIPSDKLEEFQGELENAGNLLSVDIRTDDVTEKYYDIEARLASLEAQRDRYMELLEKASSLDEIIVLDNALTDVLYQIESYTGTLNKYDSLTAYSTVTVNLQEVKDLTVIDEEPETFGDRIILAFVDSVEMLGNFFEGAVLVIVSVLPWIALPTVIVIVILVCLKKKAKKAKKTNEVE